MLAYSRNLPYPGKCADFAFNNGQIWQPSTTSADKFKVDTRGHTCLNQIMLFDCTIPIASFNCIAEVTSRHAKDLAGCTMNSTKTGYDCLFSVAGGAENQLGFRFKNNTTCTNASNGTNSFPWTQDYLPK